MALPLALKKVWPVLVSQIIIVMMPAPSLVKKETVEQAKVRAHKLLERVGLSDKFEAFPDQLSGGQQQRVAIARAVVW